MLGWHITVARQSNGGTEPCSFGDKTGGAYAVWQAGLWGLDWIKDLSRQGTVWFLGGHGYPTEFCAQMKHLRDTLLAGPPHARAEWQHDPGDVLTDRWLGRTTIDREAVSACDGEEWVHLRVWDES